MDWGMFPFLMPVSPPCLWLPCFHNFYHLWLLYNPFLLKCIWFEICCCKAIRCCQRKGLTRCLGPVALLVIVTSKDKRFLFLLSLFPLLYHTQVVSSIKVSYVSVTSCWLGYSQVNCPIPWHLKQRLTLDALGVADVRDISALIGLTLLPLLGEKLTGERSDSVLVIPNLDGIHLLLFLLCLSTLNAKLHKSIQLQ